MNPETGNFLKLPEKLDGAEELFHSLFEAKNVFVERIVSCGQKTPDGSWYDQEKDEWVILLQGEATLAYEDKSEEQLVKGDYTFIPARKKHRVAQTSKEPPCIWLAIHGDIGLRKISATERLVKNGKSKR